MAPLSVVVAWATLPILLRPLLYTRLFYEKYDKKNLKSDKIKEDTTWFGGLWYPLRSMHSQGVHLYLVYTKILLCANKFHKGILMLEQVLLQVCQEMATCLDEQQLKKLENVLFINFQGKKIENESYELVETGTDNDMHKIKLFCASKKVSGRQRSTLEQYVREIKKCRDTLNKRFEDITTMDLRWYFGILQERDHNSLVTVRGKKRYLNSFWTFLQQEGMVKSNPVARIETIKVESTIKKAFSAQELEAMRESCDNPRDRALIEFLYATGLRVSELCSLNVGDLDLYKQQFDVMGKGRKERTVYISDTACFHMYRYLKWRMKKESLTLDELANRPLFVNMKAPYNRITIAGVQYIVKKVGKVAEVGNVHPHRFRRTYATDLLNRGMRLEEVMVLMGHSKVETTLIYCNIKQDSVRESYRRFAA